MKRTHCKVNANPSSDCFDLISSEFWQLEPAFAIPTGWLSRPSSIQDMGGWEGLDHKCPAGVTVEPVYGPSVNA